MLEDPWGLHPYYSALEKRRWDPEAPQARISSQDYRGGVRVVNTTKNSIPVFVLIFFQVFW